MTSSAAGLLARQLKQMQNDKSISGISCGLVDNNVFEWEVMLMIDDDTKFYGGMDLQLHMLNGTNMYRWIFSRTAKLPPRVPNAAA